MYKQSGFTLLELITVLVLMGILAAVTLPRLSLDGQFEQRLQADNLIGLLRLAQLRAMNDPMAMMEGQDIDRCGRVLITASAFTLAKDCALTADSLLSNTELKEQDDKGIFLGINDNAHPLSITADQALPLVLQFGTEAEEPDFLSENSRLGRPFLIQDGSPVALSSPLNITLAGKTVRVEVEGYIHAP